MVKLVTASEQRRKKVELVGGALERGLMKKRQYNYLCSKCPTKLQRWSKTSASKTRWYCKNCQSTTTKPRRDLIRRYLFQQYLDWLLGKSPQNELRIPLVT